MSIVLSYITEKEELGPAWLKLMTTWKLKSPRSKTDISYGVGQPMGLYSSWAALAITNHALVKLCALLENIDDFEHYFILGDDISIFNPKVSERYVNLMNDLGVSTKPVDSIKPNDDHCLEIAKRLFRRGSEISALPYNLYKINRCLFLYYCIERGYSVHIHPETPISNDIDSHLAAGLLHAFQISEPFGTKKSSE